jgi:hypothetical protein
MVGNSEANRSSPSLPVIKHYPKQLSCKLLPLITEVVVQESGQQYQQRMVSYTVGRVPLKLLAAAPRRLERLLKGVSSSRLRKRPSADKWSIAEIVCHLADSELARSFRIRMIVAAPGTTLQTFDQDAWVVALHYEKRSVKKALQEFRILREANLALFRTLEPEQWKHRGIHPERGEQVLENLPALAAGHDINHILQIERILSRVS